MEIMFLPPPFLTNYVYFMEFEFISPPPPPITCIRLQDE